VTDHSIRVEGLGKRYTLGEGGAARYDTIQGAIKNAVLSPLQLFRKRKEPPNFWALKDVSFDVKRGEVIGIIGRNGAGKSTLLKILARITEPTEGRASIHGRVASLLEVGTGFHPELSGRENIFLNGAILGMKRAEIVRKFDEIVAFAEVEKFIDTPVKHYSSGMYVRLAFAVAAHLEPDTLIVDEVLAVGDAEFQKKCLGRMQNVSTQEGRTVLFVSHNLTAMKSLCQRAVLLDHGKIIADGEAGDVVNQYLAAEQAGESVAVWNDKSTAPGNAALKLRRVAVVPGNAAEEIDVNTPFNIEIEFWNDVPDVSLHLTVVVNTLAGECVICHGSPPQKYSVGLHRAICAVPAPLLNDGRYELGLSFVRDLSFLAFAMPERLSFGVADIARPVGTWQGKWPGFVRPALDWNIAPVDR
jgi:lipopolysaccharide transport system ATP-binding protein